MKDNILLDAATNNRRVALLRIEQGHWGAAPGFVDVLAIPPDGHVDALVCEVHGDAKYGNQDDARQTYEVLASANEMVRYGRPLHDFHNSLYAWALLFRVRNMGTLQIAANNLGRLCRAWPGAIFVLRQVEKEQSVPLAQEAGMEL